VHMTAVTVEVLQAVVNYQWQNL